MHAQELANLAIQLKESRGDILNVFHEFIDGEIIPRIVVIPSTKINWTENINHFPLPNINISEDMIGIDELAVNVTIFSDELIRIPDNNFYGGIIMAYFTKVPAKNKQGYK